MITAILGDDSEEPQVTLIAAVDLLSGIGLSCAVPAKGRSVCGRAKFGRFVLEVGRAVGIIQFDPEASSIA